jgi:hypothetical protein
MTLATLAQLRRSGGFLLVTATSMGSLAAVVVPFPKLADPRCGPQVESRTCAAAGF